ncbi:MAG: virulence factor [Bacteroidota bacterium]|nr:virulence factor [Bacteroidota bacterium]
MNKHLLLLLAPVLLSSKIIAQNLPVKEWAAATHDKPMIFYISGDGGFNKFSTALCQSLNKKGYDVYALNARSYFDDKKTPEQTTNDIKNYLGKKAAGRRNTKVILIGYSFGADVLPFILNRLPKNIMDNVAMSFIMAPSGSTDFEIHWSDIFGGNIKRDMDVVTEINKLNNENIVIINGSDEHELALNKISLKKYTHEVLPGGHHFDGDTDEITNVILGHIN